MYMTLVLRIDCISQDTYSSRGDEHRVFAALEKNPVYDIPPGTYQPTSGVGLFTVGLPADWEEKKVIDFAVALMHSAYDCTEGDKTHHANVVAGLYKMLEEHFSDIYQRFFTDGDTAAPRD